MTSPAMTDEAGYRFNDERFVVGEYVSLKEEKSVPYLPRGVGRAGVSVPV